MMMLMMMMMMMLMMMMMTTTFLFCTSFGDKARQEEWSMDKEELAQDLNEESRLAVNFDGKHLNKFGEIQEREPCLLTGFPDGRERLLEILKLENGNIIVKSEFHDQGDNIEN
jgi:hypothetical protein